MTAEELEHLRANTRKLVAEADKLEAEADKLDAERKKIAREFMLYPAFLLITAVGATAAIIKVFS